jgi:hypothetical protein
MTTSGIDHHFMHHGLIRILDVLAIVLTLLVIAYGLVNPPATLFPLSNMVISPVPPAPNPASALRQDSTKGAQASRTAGVAVPGARADGSRLCVQDKGVAGDCGAP